MLLTLARQGDTDAENQLYRSEVPLLIGMLYRNGLDYSAACDIAHQAITRAITTNKYNDLDQCRPYLKKVALSLLNNP